MQIESKKIIFADKLDRVDWFALKEDYRVSGWDTGRNPEQLQNCFENSFAVSIAFDGKKVIGTARAISDGVDASAVFDVWVNPDLRGKGIGCRLIEMLLEKLPEQYVLLSTDVSPFYEKLGFTPTKAMARKN